MASKNWDFGGPKNDGITDVEGTTIFWKVSIGGIVKPRNGSTFATINLSAHKRETIDDVPRRLQESLGGDGKGARTKRLEAQRMRSSLGSIWTPGYHANGEDGAQMVEVEAGVSRKPNTSALHW